MLVARYDASLIRLKDCSSQLETDDLDEEERKALAEVSKLLSFVLDRFSHLSEEEVQQVGGSKPAKEAQVNG